MAVTRPTGGRGKVIEVMTFDLPREDVDDFLQAVESAQVYIRRSPLCLKYQLSRQADGEPSFLLRVEWSRNRWSAQGLSSVDEMAAFDLGTSRYRPFRRHLGFFTVTDVDWEEP